MSVTRVAGGGGNVCGVWQRYGGGKGVCYMLQVVV